MKSLLIQINIDIELLSNHINSSRFNKFTDFHKCVLVLEDRRFFQHHGIDWRSFIRDIWRHFTFRKHGGFSTIEMQFVRTVTGRYERTFGRKIYEILLAYICNWHFKKFDILNSYVDIAYYGTSYPVRRFVDWGSNCENVANQVFDKSLYDINLEEAAEIAAYLVYPRPSEPSEKWARRVARRKQYALRLLPKYKNLFEQIVD